MQSDLSKIMVDSLSAVNATILGSFLTLFSDLKFYSCHCQYFCYNICWKVKYLWKFSLSDCSTYLSNVVSKTSNSIDKSFLIHLHLSTKLWHKPYLSGVLPKGLLDKLITGTSNESPLLQCLLAIKLCKFLFFV